MKEFTEAAYHLMFFKTYTTFPRWVEIALGVYAWLNVGLILICSIKLTS